jgi:predicted nucleotidyltransferase
MQYNLPNPKLGCIVPKMGKIAKASASGLGGALFPRVRLRILSFLLGQPQRKFQTAEIIRLVGSGFGATHRELERLGQAGILNVSTIGNGKFYQANEASPIFDDLQRIVLKTAGLVEPVRAALKKFRDNIDVAFIYGSVAKRADTAASDVDLMVIGRGLTYSEIYEGLHKAEKELQRTINPNVVSPDEWKKMLSERRSFASRIVQQDKLFVFGDDHELERAG